MPYFQRYPRNKDGTWSGDRSITRAVAKDRVISNWMLGVGIDTELAEQAAYSDQECKEILEAVVEVATRISNQYGGELCKS
jgi:hypothetical protein